MSTQPSLLEIERIGTDIELYLGNIGEITYRFPDHDSGCNSFEVKVNGKRWFVKYSNVPQAIIWLKQAKRFHTAIQHDALPRLHNTFATPDGLVLVYDWVDGENLRPERELGPGEVHPRDRFCALPAIEIVAALNVIYDVHLLIEKKGFIAEDFYDGCMIYNFEKKRIHLFDFDHYHPSPFINEMGRLYGSTRFMAPEEFQKGARIDETTNVFMLGRTAFVLLANSRDSRDAWKGNEAMWHVAKKATTPERQLRYQTVRHFVEAWNAAIATGEKVSNKIYNPI